MGGGCWGRMIIIYHPLPTLFSARFVSLMDMDGGALNHGEQISLTRTSAILLRPPTSVLRLTRGQQRRRWQLLVPMDYYQSFTVQKTGQVSTTTCNLIQFKSHLKCISSPALWNMPSLDTYSDLHIMRHAKAKEIEKKNSSSLKLQTFLQFPCGCVPLKFIYIAICVFIHAP